MVDTKTISEPVEEIPKNAVVLPSFMVLQVKRSGNGDVKRFRGRIVAGGNMQPKHSYKHFSAPVVEFCIVRFS